ncbi:MAG: hypothetical protein ABI743_02105 [bacterium]
MRLSARLISGLLILLSLLLLVGTLTSCSDMIDPQRQKMLGVIDDVTERYNSAKGLKEWFGPPKYPGMRKLNSFNLEVFKSEPEDELKKNVATMLEWFAESSSRMSTGQNKLYVYAMKDGTPIWVGVYEAAALSGKDIDIQAPSEANLPQGGDATNKS